MRSPRHARFALCAAVIPDGRSDRRPFASRCPYEQCFADKQHSSRCRIIDLGLDLGDHGRGDGRRLYLLAGEMDNLINQPVEKGPRDGRMLVEGRRLAEGDRAQPAVATLGLGCDQDRDACRAG